MYSDREVSWNGRHKTLNVKIPNSAISPTKRQGFLSRLRSDMIDMNDRKVQQHTQNLAPRDAGFDLRQVLNHRRHLRIQDTMEMTEELYTSDCSEEADGTGKVEKRHSGNPAARDAGFDLRQILNHRGYMRSQGNHYDELSSPHSSKGSDDYIEDIIQNTVEMMKELCTDDNQSEADGTGNVEEPAGPMMNDDTVEMEVLEEATTPIVDGDAIEEKVVEEPVTLMVESEICVQHSLITSSYLKSLKCARPLHASTLASFDD